MRTSDFKGKNVLIDFFGVNCPPCKLQMSVLSEIYLKYKNSNLELISIDVWIKYGETAENVQNYISTFKQQNIYLNWTFGVDDKQGTLFKKYITEGVPTLYLLDKNGNIYYTTVGYTQYSILSNKIDELLK